MIFREISVTACITALVFVCAALFGLAFRSGYTDISRDENYLDSLMVAELPAGITANVCRRLAEELPEIPIIVRVTASGELENLYHISRQKVRVEQVYAGENISAGTEFYLISGGWRLILDEDYRVVERSFVNVMKVGKEYLLFLTERAESDDDSSVYRLYDESVLAPIFPYENSEHTFVQPSGDSTYVPYVQVKDNDFFVESEEALELLTAFKERLLENYPRSP